MKKVLKIIGLILLAILLAAGIYVAYVFLDYERIEDNQELEINHGDSASGVPVNEELKITSFNIGFGAYVQDYTFFMDGGKESRARSEEELLTNMDRIVETLKEQEADFYLIQEVDKKGTRTYGVDEEQIITGNDAFSGFDSTYAINYDSPYLFYPITSPHGKNLAGILTLSEYEIEDALRRSLPIQDGFAKLLDLDRAYSINRIPTADGKELCLYNFHLSAYTTDETVVTRQLAMLSEDMKSDYEAGNYVIAGGDCNMDLLGDGGEAFGKDGEEFSWAQPFPINDLPDSMSLVAPRNPDNPIPSCRNCDEAYDPQTTFVITVDGFIVSDNVEVIASDVVDMQFMYSDHNPVYMQFILKK